MTLQVLVSAGFLFLFDNSYLFAGIYTKAVYRAENKNIFAFWGGNMHKM